MHSNPLPAVKTFTWTAAERHAWRIRYWRPCGQKVYRRNRRNGAGLSQHTLHYASQHIERVFQNNNWRKEYLVMSLARMAASNNNTLNFTSSRNWCTLALIHFNSCMTDFTLMSAYHPVARRVYNFKSCFRFLRNVPILWSSVKFLKKRRKCLWCDLI